MRTIGIITAAIFFVVLVAAPIVGMVVRLKEAEQARFVVIHDK